MRKNALRLTAISLAVCMGIGWACLDMGAQASAAETQTDTIDQIADQFGDTSEDPYDYLNNEDRKEAKKAAQALPDKFDLRNVDTNGDGEGDGVSYVTPVKFQNPFGNCWGFAAIAAAETSILGDNELRGNYVADIRKTTEADKIQMDLSEKQLTYFARTPINDPANPQNGEGDKAMTLDPSEDPVAAVYNMGGHAPNATTMFAAGVGPVLESVNPLFEYKGKKGLIQKDWVGDSFQRYEYSASDDWSLDESLRFSQSFSLGESYVVPSPAKIDSSGFNNTYEYNPAGVTAIKEQLVERRGVQIGYRDDTFNPAFEDHGDYINSNYAHYTYLPESPRHAVCIVGWDDNYKAENFRHPVEENDEGITEKDTVPPGDGAWLVKNSWGSGEEDFPNRGEGTWGIPNEDGEGTGYFWLSYYDQSIATPEALDFQVETGETVTDVIDQHDLLSVSKYLAAHVDSQVSTANVFKASDCEEIRKVSCETTYPGTEVTFQVYLLANGFDSPTNGLLMDTVTKTFEYGGFHKVDLNKPFTVMRGQSYSIVVSQKVEAETGTAYAAGVKLGTGTVVVNKGESFIYADGSWQDMSDQNLRQKLLEKVENSDGADAMDNFPIKGYGLKKQDRILEVGYSGFLSLGDPNEEEVPKAFFKAWITDSTGGADPIAVTPEWKILAGGDGVIELTDGRDASRKTVTCKRLGKDYLVISVEGIGQVIHSIKLEPMSPAIAGIKTGGDFALIALDFTKQEGLSGIEVSYREKGAASWTKKVFGPDAKTLKLTGLKAGKRYEVKVRSFVDSKYGRMNSSEESAVSGVVGLANTIKAKGKTVKVKAAKLKKGKVKIARKKAITVSKARGTVTYTKLSVNKKKFAKKFTVNKKTGKITIKKGLKKGTYKVRIKVKAAGKGVYLPAVRTVTVTVKVK